MNFKPIMHCETFLVSWLDLCGIDLKFPIVALEFTVALYHHPDMEIQSEVVSFLLN